MSSRVSLALVHHPVRGRDGAIITTSITNLDVHDIARTARTYGLARYFIVTPIEAQRALVEHILGYWRDGDGARRVPERAEALAIVSAVPSLADARAQLGGQPLVLTTAARGRSNAVSYAQRASGWRGEANAMCYCCLGRGIGLRMSLSNSGGFHLCPRSARRVQPSRGEKRGGDRASTPGCLGMGERDWGSGGGTIAERLPHPHFHGRGRCFSVPAGCDCHIGIQGVQRFRLTVDEIFARRLESCEAPRAPPGR